MIIEKEVSEILQRELPEINTELEKLQNGADIYKTMECFVDFTKQLINKGMYIAVKDCFRLAERMLADGNNTVKNAIENVYVYSLGIVLELSASTSNTLNEIFNGSLRKEYNRQVCASGK
jgi:hypothetical protein